MSELFRTCRVVTVDRTDFTVYQQRAKALEELCRTYWYPVYAFIRRNGHEPADAQDLTQGFFEHVLERHTFEAASPEKGRFRSFLLGILKNFLSYERRKASALKRGGSMMFVPLDGHDDEERFQLDLVHALTPEKLYDRSWTHALLAKTVEVLGREYERAGKRPMFVALQPYLTGMGSDVSYKELGERIGLSVGAVTTSIHRMRKRYAELLRQEIAQTVSSPMSIPDDGEIRISVLVEISSHHVESGAKPGQIARGLNDSLTLEVGDSDAGFLGNRHIPDSIAIKVGNGELAILGASGGVDRGLIK